MNEQRIDKLTRILRSVSAMGGEAETTKIVTNLEVTDAAPPVTTVPAGYIIVENDQGFNVPAQEVPGVSYADGDLVNVLYVKGSEPVAIQQGSSSPSSNLWEIVPATTTDIFYDGGLVGINNPTPAYNLDVLGDVVIDTDVFYVDNINDFIGMGTVVSTTSQQLSILVDANKDILIDGSTNPRDIDTGVIRFEQTPAITDTRCITLNVDASSQENTHAVVVNIVATGIGAGETISAYDTLIDLANSSGGEVHAYEVSAVGPGSAIVQALHVNPNIDVIHHESGTFISVEQAWQDDGGFVDTTAAFNGAPDINIFVNNGTVCYWGMAAVFDEIEVVLNTVASGPGIKPTFEFSDGIGGWTTFPAVDETQGFRQPGVITWEIPDLIGWATDTVNGVANKFWIRITRTQVALTTPPNEETLLVAATIEYLWDEDGIVTINNLIVEEDVTHRDDADTKVAFTDDTITITVGGEILLTLTEAGQDVVKLGDGGDVDVNLNDMAFLRGSDGLLAVGNVAPAALLDVTKTFADGTRIIDVSAIAQPNANYFAVDIGPQIEPQANIGTIWGSLNTLVVDNSAFNITSDAIACQYQVQLKATYSGTVTRAIALNTTQPQLLGAATITEAVGLNIGAMTVATTNKSIVTRNASAANRWNLYLQGTADNYLKGDTGIGVILPQGKLHTYETISGFLLWEYDGLNATIRTVIPNGAGDVLYRLHAEYVLRNSVGAVLSGSTDVSNGASVNLVVGADTVRLRVNADGSCDVARTAGANTIKVALTLRWL